jgi:hypothetical protein
MSTAFFLSLELSDDLRMTRTPTDDQHRLSYSGEKREATVATALTALQD